MSSVLQELKVDSLVEQYQGLLEVSEAIISHRDLAELFQVLAARLRPLVDFDYVNVFLHDAARNVMRLRLMEAPDEKDFKPEWEFAVEESPSGWVWQNQQPLVVDDIETEARFPKVIEIMREHGIKCFCVLPLTSAGRRLGTLGFGSGRECAYGQTDMKFLGQVAKQVAVAVDNALNFEQTEEARCQLERERDRLRLVLAVNNAVVTALDLRELFGIIAKCLRQVIPNEYTGLSLYDAERSQLQIYALDFAQGKGFLREGSVTALKDTPAGRAITSGQPILLSVKEVESYDSDFARRILAEGLRSGCCLPLISHNRTLGTLTIASFRESAFTSEDLEFLSQIATQIAIAVENALAFGQIEELKNKLADEKLYLEEEIRTEHNFTEIVGHSGTLKRTLQAVEIVAPTDSVVLIQGETGTGKELIARAIHNLSARRERTLVKLNCAAIPTGLLESELFGHERGAFTGAIERRVGRFEVAHKGTLFLDEVGDIPLELQPKLLRVLQEQEFERLGSSRTVKVDVRVIAATNRDLAQMVADHQFRADLYYRLNVFPVRIPPLRERPTDIPLLVAYFTQYYARRMNKRIESIPAEAVAELQRCTWAGNVRELENYIERAVIITRGSHLQIPLAELESENIAHNGEQMKLPNQLVSMSEMERAHIEAILRHTKGQIGGSGGAADILGLPVSTLRSRMKKLGIRYAH